MEAGRLRSILAIIIVGGYLAITASIILATVFLDFDHDFAIEVIEEVSKVMAGFVGLVIGYYFYRSQSSRSEQGASSGPTDGGRQEDAIVPDAAEWLPGVPLKPRTSPNFVVVARSMPFFKKREL